MSNNEHSNHGEHGKSPELFVDNVGFDWDQSQISGAQVRSLASVPETVDLFMKVPGSPDKIIDVTTIITLADPKPHFSTQAAGSKGG